MSNYETLFIAKPTLTEEEVQSEVKRVQDIIVQEGGDLVATDVMGMRKLAYPIEKQERGFSIVVYYKALSDLIGELERQLRYNENILRFMTVKYAKKKEIVQFEKSVAAISKNSSEAKSEEGAEAAAPEATSND